MNERNDLANTNSSETASLSLQPMSFVDILDGMFSLYRSHFRLFLRIVLVYLVFGFVINLVSTFAVTDATSSTSIVIVLTSIASILLAYWVGWGLTYASAQVYLGRDITSQDALRQAWRRFLPLLGSSILWLLAVGGFWFITIVGILVVTVTSIHWSLYLLIVVISVPFSIYFSVRWGLYTLPVLFEETTARNALRRSTELVKGTWWRVFGICLAISLIALMIAFILQTSYAIIFSSLAGGTGAEDGNFWETLRRLFMPTPNDVGWIFYSIRTLGSLIIAGLTMPIGTVGYVLLYFDLRIRKEAFDIEMQVTN